MITVVGTREELDHATAFLGEESADRFDLDRAHFDYRRIFVSDPKVAGPRLRDLNLPQQFGAVIARIRRGDIEFLRHGDTVLELGDRIRVLTHHDRMEAVSRCFGDSHRAVSEIDVLTFSLGFALEQTRNELPNIGYATMYPIATISKIIFAQLMLAALL